MFDGWLASGPARQLLALAFFIVICLTAASTGALVTKPEIGGWYASLNKPSWNPPNRVFGPVWTLLYLMMAISGWLVWRELGTAEAALPLAFFTLQLLLNATWSILFFGLHRPGLAFSEIVLLWFAILATIISFWRVTPMAGALLLPYLGWVTFAAALNYVIWRLNS